MDQKIELNLKQNWYKVSPDVVNWNLNDLQFTYPLRFFVCSVPGGWLVSSGNEKQNYIFVPDDHHSWFPSIALADFNIKKHEKSSSV